jgi:hypothetical protein
MNQEEREALTQETTQCIVACLHQTTNAEQMIGSLLTGYGVAMFAAGGTQQRGMGRLYPGKLAHPHSHHAHAPRRLRRTGTRSSLSLEDP